MNRNRVALSASYFGFFALLGLMVPYLSVFLKAQQLDSAAIGWILAATMATRVVAPFAWGALADALQAPLSVARCGAILALLSFALLYTAHSIIWIITLLLVFSFFWTAILPQIEVLTLRELAEDKARYTRIRVWGSIGFIVISVGAGWLIDHYGIPRFIDVGSLLLCLLSMSLWLVSRPATGAVAEQHAASAAGHWLTPSLVILLVVNFLLQFSHGPYYSFFVLYMGQLGFSKTIAGVLVGIGVTAEVVVFMVIGYWLKRYSARLILQWALVMASVRWLLMTFVPGWLPALIVAQLLHAFSFGVAHAASIKWLSQRVDPRNQSKVQSLYASAGFGAGGVAGAVLSGWLWQEGAGAFSCYLVAAGATVLAAIILWVWRHRQHHETWSKAESSQQA